MPNSPIDYAQNNRSRYLEMLKELLSIPSISTQSVHNSDMQRCAEWLTQTMRSIGLKNTTIYPTPGHPLVYGEWLEAGPNAPTVLIYGHYDVQPPDPLDLWKTPPFEPSVRGDNIYARGATDDKGQLFPHLAAVDALLKTTGALPVNLKFIIEGEEESGGENLEPFIKSHQDLLAANCALISDTPIISPEQPSIVYALRGVVALEIEVISAKRDLHSGQYGGAIHNPLLALSQILSAMLDENNRVTIPGFYDDVAPLSDEERALLAKLPDTLLQETGARNLWGDPAFTPAERVSARPTFEIHGIVGGYTDEGVKTVIPAKATAKVSMRLAPNQDPDKIVQLFTAYVNSLAPDTVNLKIRQQGLAGKPAIIDRSRPSMVAASNAYQAAFQRRPIFTREGGSIPVVSAFQHLLGLPVVMMGFGLTSDRLHSPNEKLHLPNFYRGIETSIHFMQEYARLKTT